MHADTFNGATTNMFEFQIFILICQNCLPSPRLDTCCSGRFGRTWTPVDMLLADMSSSSSPGLFTEVVMAKRFKGVGQHVQGLVGP